MSPEMSFASFAKPSRCTLLLWAAGICAAIAMTLAIVTHESSADSGRKTPPARHGWVRGLYANDELHRGTR